MHTAITHSRRLELAGEVAVALRLVAPVATAASLVAPVVELVVVDVLEVVVVSALALVILVVLTAAVLVDDDDDDHDIVVVVVVVPSGVPGDDLGVGGVAGDLGDLDSISLDRCGGGSCDGNASSGQKEDLGEMHFEWKLCVLSLLRVDFKEIMKLKIRKI